MRPVILSYGMGVESTAALVRWCDEPTSRDFSLADLTVVSSQTGDEHADQKYLLERFILPKLRARRIRYVQVARAGHLESDGIVVLDDSRQPREALIDGAYKLSDELTASGTVPQFGGENRCALKFKAFVIETWLARYFGPEYRHAFGYNADETGRADRATVAMRARMAFGFNVEEQKRADRAATYDHAGRTAFFPLIEWGWSRADCFEYLLQKFSVAWQRSACVYCPFNRMDEAAVARLLRHPQQTARALLLEYVSLALNPRGSLYRDQKLYDLLHEVEAREVLKQFRQLLKQQPYALYRVRRIYTAKGKAYRAVEVLRIDEHKALRGAWGSYAKNAEVEDGTGELCYAWQRRRVEGAYPSGEELFVVTPHLAQDKTRYGLPWFEEKWNQLDQVC